MSFRIPNIAPKCSKGFFLKASVERFLKRAKARARILLTSVIVYAEYKILTTSDEIVSMLNINL